MDDYYSALSTFFAGITVNALTTGAIVALVVALVLLVCSAIVSGSEIAFFSLTPSDMNDIHERKHPNDETLLELLDDSERLLLKIVLLNEHYWHYRLLWHSKRFQCTIPCCSLTPQ